MAGCQYTTKRQTCVVFVIEPFILIPPCQPHRTDLKVTVLTYLSYYHTISVVCQWVCSFSLCQPFLGALITPVNPALYFCTLLRLPRDIRRLVSYSSSFVLQTKNQTG